MNDNHELKAQLHHQCFVIEELQGEVKFLNHLLDVIFSGDLTFIKIDDMGVKYERIQ